MFHQGGDHTAKGKNFPLLSTAELLSSKHGVTDRTVKNAGANAEAIDKKAIPELIEKVEQGKVSVGAASKVASLPQEEQKEIANSFPLRTKPRDLCEHECEQRNSRQRLKINIRFFHVLRLSEVLPSVALSLP
ncbi:hypothetical protein [Methylobacter sp.]|uniref:hypothetical protein n=1 Tax=Methylobacter sp. TaxID=2051955 RepID=UPI003DA35E48